MLQPAVPGFVTVDNNNRTSSSPTDRLAKARGCGVSNPSRRKRPVVPFFSSNHKFLHPLHSSHHPIVACNTQDFQQRCLPLGAQQQVPFPSIRQNTSQPSVRHSNLFPHPIFRVPIHCRCSYRRPITTSPLIKLQSHRRSASVASRQPQATPLAVPYLTE